MSPCSHLTQVCHRTRDALRHNPRPPQPRPRAAHARHPPRSRAQPAARPSSSSCTSWLVACCGLREALYCNCAQPAACNRVVEEETCHECYTELKATRCKSLHAHTHTHTHASLSLISACVRLPGGWACDDKGVCVCVFVCVSAYRMCVCFPQSQPPFPSKPQPVYRLHRPVHTTL